MLQEKSVRDALWNLLKELQSSKVFANYFLVGGKNIVKMDSLKKLFDEMGFMDVKTYIQSGNVLAKGCEKDKTKLVKKNRGGFIR